MKKLGLTSIIVAVAVIAIVAVLYLAYVGVTAAAPNVGEQKDPTGRNRDPIGYVVITFNCEVQLSGNWRMSSSSLDAQTFPWVNGTNTINQVVQNQKLGPLGTFSSYFGGWITLRVTGPGNYVPATYTSPIQKVRMVWSDLSPRKMTFGPYTAKFWDPGQYSVHVVLWTTTTSTDSTPLQMGQQTHTFNISQV